MSSPLTPHTITAPIVPRQNLATVTYPVSLASDSQAIRDPSNGLYNTPTTNRIDPFAILLTRKDQHMRPGSKRLGVFTRLNNLKGEGLDIKAKRASLLNDLRFAGIAHSGVSEEFANDGAPGQIAAVIGGSHTVMSFRHDHSLDPLHPGTRVRWTLPEIDNTFNKPRLAFYGECKTGVFAELEPINEANTAQEIFDLCTGPKPTIETITKILAIYQNLNEREIGTVIGDNGKGSIDIRLK
jgi:hypothetical protein